jgi:uncharacterized membrane protein
MTSVDTTGDSLLAARMPRSHQKAHGWKLHPGVRSHAQLTLGERAADRMRNGMGSWMFVLGALLFLGVWMAFNGKGGFDPYPFILLNLVLSCLAALQGAILLIAAKRSDQIASELAQHDFDTDVTAKQLIEQLGVNFTAMAEQHRALHDEVAPGGHLLHAPYVAHTRRPPARPPLAGSSSWRKIR